MSFLDRLVARSLGTPAALQPRPLSPFEAPGARPLQDSVESLDLETTFEGRDASPAAPGPLRVAPIFAAPLTPESGPSRTRTSLVDPPLPVPPTPLRPPAPQVPIAAVEGISRRLEPPPSASPSPRLEVPSPRPEAPSEPKKDRPQAEPRIPLVPRPADPRPPIEVRRERHERIVMAPPAVAAAPKTSMPTGLQPLPAAPPRRLPATSPAAPDVHIHIGRIEVRATRPEAAPSPSRAPEVVGPSALERYLEARTRGTR